MHDIQSGLRTYGTIATLWSRSTFVHIRAHVILRSDTVLHSLFATQLGRTVESSTPGYNHMKGEFHYTIGHGVTRHPLGAMR